MYKILKINSQIGRCFISQGRIVVWCQQKRSYASMAPEEVQHAKINQKSKVFTAAITLLNFLSCIHENRKESYVKDSKKTKKNQQQKHKINESARQITYSNNKAALYTNSTLPTEIKLFFNPKDTKQYFSTLETLENRLAISSFWTQMSEGLRQLIMNMLSIDSNQRIDLQTILNIAYFQQSQQLKLYFTLADEMENGMEIKEKLIFMKILEILIKQGTVFEKDILDDYILPVLIKMTQTNIHINKQKSLSNNNNSNPNIKITPVYSSSSSVISQSNHNLLSVKSLSILIQLTCPPIQTIYNALKNCSIDNKHLILLALQKKQRLFYLLDEVRFESALTRLLFCCYQYKQRDNNLKQNSKNEHPESNPQHEQMLNIAVTSTPFILSCIKQNNIKKEIEYKLINKILSIQINSQKTEKLLLNGLKCAIQLLKKNWITNPSKYLQVKFEPMQLQLQSNIHILYFYGLIANYIPSKMLISTLMPKLDPYLSQPLLSDELFMTAYSLSKKILCKLSETRKIKPETDEIRLEYSQQYFKLKDELAQVNQDISKEMSKIRNYIQTNQLRRLEWIMKDIF